VRADLHGYANDVPGETHVVVDEECLHLILAEGGNPFSARLVFPPCACVEQSPPFGATTLLGFLVGAE
jgi:hypothetical protein